MAEPQRERASVCVIGAGLTGLFAAYRLLRAGHDVCLLESTLQPGGMVASFPLGQTRIEAIYHHIFTSDDEVTGLLDELGLDNRLRWHQPREAILRDGRLFAFSTPFDLLRFQALPLFDRIRTGLVVLKAGRLSDWQILEQETATQWLRRTAGPTSYEKLWKPLLTAKFDDSSEEVSAVWIWNKFKLRGGSRGSKVGSSKLGYLDGSFGRLVDALVLGIRQAGGRIHFGHTAMNIARDSHPDGRACYRVSCILENCTTVEVETNAVLATVSGRQFASITTGLSLPDEYRNRLERQRYKGNLCLILRLRRSLSPYYWTTVCDPHPFVAVIEHSHLTGSEIYGGHVVYLSRYLDVSDPLWMQSDGEIFQLFRTSLEQIYPQFSPADVIDWRLRRTRYAQPVIQRLYSQLMPKLDTPDPGIKLAGMGQIYPEDRGMNYALRLGRQAAEAVDRSLATRKEVADA